MKDTSIPDLTYRSHQSNQTYTIKQRPSHGRGPHSQSRSLPLVPLARSLLNRHRFLNTGFAAKNDDSNNDL